MRPAISGRTTHHPNGALPIRREALAGICRRHPGTRIYVMLEGVPLRPRSRRSNATWPCKGRPEASGPDWMRHQHPRLAVRGSDARMPATTAAQAVVTRAKGTEGPAWCCRTAHIAPSCSKPAACELIQNGPPSVGRNQPTMMATTQTTTAVPSAFGKLIL